MEELSGPLGEVFKDLKEKWKEFQEAEPFIDVVKGFLRAIDWSELWIIGLLLLNLALIFLAIITRTTERLQLTIAAFCILAIYFGERLNSLGNQYWELFSRQNYFDRHGIFYGCLVGGPMLIVLLILLVNYLLNCSALLVKAKVAELKFKAKQRMKETESGSNLQSKKKD